MKKTEINKDVYYTLAWSQVYRYDKYEALRILPELSGIFSLMYINQSVIKHLIFFNCWRDGCRVGLRRFLDPYNSLYPEIRDQIDNEKLFFKYTIVEGNIAETQDIMYWLIKTYTPRFNDYDNFKDSQRYKNIFINEIERNAENIIEKI
jgi:hypothetical protein